MAHQEMLDADIRLNKQSRSNPWRLYVAAVGVCTFAFFFAFEMGQFHIDRTQHIAFQITGGFTLVYLWLLKTIWRLKASRAKLALGVGIAVLILVLPSVYAGFRLGEDAVYSPDAKRIVHQLQFHLKQIELLEDDVSTRRQSVRNPEELLQLRPDIESLDGHVRQVERLLSEIHQEDTPVFVSGLIDLMREGVALNRRELENVKQQFAVIISARAENAREKGAAYRKYLLPLIKEEADIEVDENNWRTSYPRRLQVLRNKAGFE